MTHSNGIPFNLNGFRELSEKGVRDVSLSEANLTSIFEPNESTASALSEVQHGDETNLTVEDYVQRFPIVSDGIWFTVERPTTNEFQEHDKEMEMLKAEYIKNHPEPEFDPYAKCINSEHDKWAREMQKYMDAQETIYRESHPEYAKQAQAYEEQKRRASLFE